MDSQVLPGMTIEKTNHAEFVSASIPQDHPPYGWIGQRNGCRVKPGMTGWLETPFPHRPARAGEHPGFRADLWTRACARVTVEFG
jgi:hypothetical protein